MKMFLVKGLMLAVLCVAMMSPANACSRKAVSGENQVIGSAKSINASLLDASVRLEVNYHRCRAGLPPLRSEARLTKIAKGHSDWMARARNLSHKSTVSGRRTLKDRMKRTGIRYTAAAENIGVLPRFRIGRKRFSVRDAASCQFTDSAGQAVPAHSYQSLSRKIVGMWLASPGHRRNILNPGMRVAGAAIALDTKARFCGQYYITQNFSR